MTTGAFFPRILLRALRQCRSPAQDPSGPPAKQPPASVGGGPGQNPCQKWSSAGGAKGRVHTPPLPARWHCPEPADSSPSGASGRGESRHGRSNVTVAGPLPDAASGSCMSTATPARLQVEEQQIPDMRSEGELSCSEEEESQSHPAPRDSGAAAVGGTPGHPGKSSN